MECINGFFLRNSQFFPSARFCDNELKSNRVIYDVLRIVDGVPLFWASHYERLQNSSIKSGIPIRFPQRELYEKIHKVVAKNEITNGNIKIALTFPRSSTGQALLIYPIAHHYPTANQYNLGVSTLSLDAERKNPNVKLINHKLREQCNQLIEEQDVYEVLLVDRNKNITEGSRSNIFFIHGNEIITPPVTDVLPGITRAAILKICSHMGLGIFERKVALQEIANMDGIFISGTSPKVLPVVKVDGFTFSFESILLKRIMQAYDKMIEDYIIKFARE